MGGISGSCLASGVFAALLTPRKPDSAEADAGRLLEYLDKVSAVGVDGLVFFGATGEFVHFGLDERMRVVALATKRSRLPVLVNVSHSTLAGAIALAEQAATAGAAGLLLMPPYFYQFPDRIVAEFYNQFVKSVGKALPIYLYNLPQFTTPLSSELAQHLLASGSFAGIKNSGAEWTMFQALLEFREQHPFQLLVGNEMLLFKGLAAGAEGSISGVAAAFPELPVAIHRAVRSGDGQIGSLLAKRLDELMIWIEKLPPLITLKQIAEARSLLPFTPAVPLDETSKAAVCEFRRWFEGWLSATLEACHTVAVTSVRP